MIDENVSLYDAFRSIAVFRNAAADSTMQALKELLCAREKGGDIIGCYAGFVSELYQHGTDLSEYILSLVLRDENVYITRAGRDEPDELLREAAFNELEVMQRLSRLTPEYFRAAMDYSGFLPEWRTSDIGFAEEYRRRTELVHIYGYGKYAGSSMFIFKDGSIVPVRYPDTQRLSELYGYENERRAVVENTLALLSGKQAQNALLYGDAGTGKSSTVKAVVNEFAGRGLRLIEMTKEQLRDIPAVIDEISGNPLKFILFIDDLSFTSGEDCFGALKATLEGSVSARADNMVIYATSNRRHLIKESFSDREGDDVHRNDTMQEMLSLSARFGLRVNFSRPDKKSYTAIAMELAKSAGIVMDEAELSLRAEQFAISSGNGRSPRTAKQFVRSLVNQR